MDSSDWVITIAGEDRPGILDDVCGIIQRNDGHVTDLRSVDVGGHFAMLVQVKMMHGAEEALKLHFEDLAGYTRLKVSIVPAVPIDRRPTLMYRLTASGSECAGALKKLSHLLRVLSINIETIQTFSETETNSTMSLIVSIPREMPVNKFKEFLAQLLAPSEMSWELTSI